MTSNKPYLIRALYEWLVDNDATPHILVDTTFAEVMIPPGIDKDGQVVLNIAARAVQGLLIENTHISFTARFGGVSQNLYIPIPAVMAIYSMEDGQGMMFAEETTAHKNKPSEKPSEARKALKEDPKPPQKKNKPGLKIVK